jgi:hypothetical protein
VNAVLYYLHEVLLPALGWHLSWHLRDVLGLTGATAIAGGFIVIVLAAVIVAAQPGRCRVFVITAVATGLVFTAITSAFAWGGPGQQSRSGSSTAPGMPRCPSCCSMRR